MTIKTQPLFTIGHSSHPVEDFIALLQRHGIEVLADVRSAPASRRHPQFNKRELNQTLNYHGIRYVFLGRQLGARRSEPEAWEDGSISYDRIAQPPAFREGLDWLRDNINAHRVAIMCAEKEPLHCHRTLLICRHLREESPIRHILADGTLESHEDLEQRLLVEAGLNDRQKDLFDEQEESALDRAYRRR